MFENSLYIIAKVDYKSIHKDFSDTLKSLGDTKHVLVISNDDVHIRNVKILNVQESNPFDK